MADTRRTVTEWIASHQNVFELDQVDEAGFTVSLFACTPTKDNFKIICDDNWNPIFVSSDEGSIISEAVEMVNMHLQVNAAQSLYQVLTRAADALSSLIPTKTPSVPQPTVNNPQPSTSPTPSDNDQPTPDTPAPSISPPTQPAPAPPPAPANDSIQAQVERWKNENGYTGLILNGVQEEQFKADLSFTTQGMMCTFQILFDETWFPMIVVSDSPLLGDIITQMNVLLEEQQNQLQNPDTEAPARYTLSELLNVFGAAFNNDLRQSGNIEDDNSVTPTNDDWENSIIPSCTTFMISSGIARFEADEWIRRLRTAIRQQNFNKAFTIVVQEIFGGAPLPSAVSRFVPRRLAHTHAYNPHARTSEFNTAGGTPQAVERLMNELQLLRASSSTTARQFVVNPINNDLFLWGVRLRYDASYPEFAQDLAEFYKRANKTQFSNIVRIGNHTNAPEVHLEMKFPPDYPESPPLLRIIRPRFLSTNGVETMFARASGTSNGNHEEIDGEPISSRRGLSISHQFERALTHWDPTASAIDLLKQLHDVVQQQKVDLEHADDEYAIPTVGSFWRLYTCLEIEAERKDIEGGGKIVLPPSAIEDLASQEFGDTQNFDQASDSSASPMIFELSPVQPRDPRTIDPESSTAVARTFCGVAEFTANEGTVVMPRWMMENLGVHDGAMVQVRRVSLPRASFLRLLPHNEDFLHLANPKALLEWVLPHYVSLTPGDIIQISFDDRNHVLQVLEVAPGRAVCLTESDVTVDFAPPLNAATPQDSTNTTATTSTSTTTTTTTTTTTPGSVLGSMADGVEGVDYQTCENCRAAVPKARYATHSLSCPRINWYCETCKKVVQRSQKDEHIKSTHTPVPCPLGCGESIEPFKLNDHVEHACSKRSRECEFCGLSVTAANWHSHESACGDRTDVCEACGQRYQRRDQIRHLSVCGTTPATKTPTRTPTAPRRQEEDLFQCEKCGSYINGFDELQVHMLTQHDDTAETSPPAEEAAPGTPN